MSLEMFWISLNFYFWAGQLTLVICNISSQGGINNWTDAWVSQKNKCLNYGFFSFTTSSYMLDEPPERFSAL